MQILYEGGGRQGSIQVNESATTRYLELDGCEEGAMSLHSEDPVFQYLWFHKCSVFAGPRPRRALSLGAGAFTAAKCLALDYPDAEIDAVDAEPELEPIARRFFGLDRPEFARIRFHGMLAEEYLTRCSTEYDFIFDDMFDGFQHVPATSLVREHFIQLRGRLAERGILIKNLIWNPHSAMTRAACVEAQTALASIFPFHVVLALGDDQRGHNRLLIGGPDSMQWEWSTMRERLHHAGMPESVTSACIVHVSPSRPDL